MSDQSVPVTYAEALEAFEQAYAAFLAAFEQAPDAALAYVPPGDAYSLGILPLHLQDQIQDYMTLLQDMLKAAFAALDRSQDTERETRATNRYAYLAEQRPTGADRAGMLAELASAHRDAHTRLAALDEATAKRTAPVIYSAGTAPIQHRHAPSLAGSKITTRSIRSRLRTCWRNGAPSNMGKIAPAWQVKSQQEAPFARGVSCWLCCFRRLARGGGKALLDHVPIQVVEECFQVRLSVLLEIQKVGVLEHIYRDQWRGIPDGKRVV